MSVKELRARIEKLSVEIDLQKELLKQLERDKSLVQKQLNAVLDPVSRLPLEISSEIFLQSLPPSHPEPGAHYIPMLLLHVCNAWTTIALSTPALWAGIHMVFPCAKGLKELLPIWLHRAQRRPLSVSLEGKVEKGVADVLWEYGQQLKHLQICDRWDERGIDLLGGLVLGPLPLLETLTIRCPTGGLSLHYPNTQILQLLRQAPRLVECFLEVTVARVDSPLEVPAQQLVLPFLRRLMFGGDETGPSSAGNGVLEDLSLPALETLSILLADDNLASFLKRSLPSLQELQVICSDLDRLEACLRLVPTVARFDMWCGPRLAEELWAALADAPSLLPHLRSLTIRTPFDDTSHAWWQTLLRALTARHTQLRVVSIIDTWSNCEFKELATDTRTAFQDLAAEGMQLYIGNSDRTSNLLH